jgi:selenocysteine-specific elongation factor
VGGGTVIEPVAEKRRRSDLEGLDALEVAESGSLESRVLEKLVAYVRPASTEQLALDVGEGVESVAAALGSLVRRGSVVSPASARWLLETRWFEAREAIASAVREYAEKHPSRYGVMKGELKSGFKATMDGALFDVAFASLLADGEIEQTGERVRPGGMPWEPPAATVALLEKLEKMLETDGYLVPENDTWGKALGAGSAEAAALGFFLGRLVRVNADLTYTAVQMERLRAVIAGWFDGGHETMSVADFRGITGASRKYGVPLLEHSDRVGWTVRVGDERRLG